MKKTEKERIMEVLEAREERVDLLEKLLRGWDGSAVVVRCNYPGIDKNNPTSQKVVESLGEALEKIVEIRERTVLDSGEGLVYIYLTREGALPVKKKTVSLEETHPYGRLGDIDVYDCHGRGVSRRDTGFPARRCYLCEDEAHRCVRSRKHSLEEVVKYIEERVEKDVQ